MAGVCDRVDFDCAVPVGGVGVPGCIQPELQSATGLTDKWMQDWYTCGARQIIGSQKGANPWRESTVAANKKKTLWDKHKTASSSSGHRQEHQLQ